MMMASDTVPAAVPGPGDPAAGPASPQADQPRGLAGLLSAVDPARPTEFTLNPTTDTGEQTLTGASSDDYHHTPDTETGSKSNGTSTGRGQNSVWRAWMLAGAERWKKGADARNKALDIKKAKAQALQVKESRSVNRSEKFVGGSTNTGSSTNSNSGKSLNNKSHNSGNSSGGSNRGSNGSHGGAGGSGRNGSGGGGGGRGSSGGTNSNRRSHNDGSHGKQHGDKHSGGGSGSRSNSTGDKSSNGKGGTNNGSKGSQGGAGQQGPKGPSGGKGPAGASGNSGRNGTGSGGSGVGGKGSKNNGSTSDTATNRTKNNSPTPGPTKVHSPGDSSGRPWKTDKPTDTKAPKRPGEKNTSGPKTPPSTSPVSLQKKPAQTLANTPSTGKTPNTPRTQASRETGYRDGTRAARAANHVVAYRDGVRDGWNDERERGRHEAQQLDQAHAQHKQPQTQQQPTVKVPPMPTHAPTNAAPQPIPVTGIDATHIQLGNGASRTHISRGEVRTLAGFQRKLTDKADALNRVAERTRALEAHAKAQADKATKLLEQARAVKGGEKLAAALAKLQEAAKVQEGQAAEVRKRAVRATEACTTVAANADTRYGGIYCAVVNSPETAPAELTYYRDLGITNA